MTSFDSKGRLPGEFELIEELFAPLATAPGAFSLTDDAAVLAAPPGRDLVVTVDALVEGVHFLAGDPAALIAQKALRVNLSDLAAKGSTPIGYLLTICIPPQLDLGWLRAFANGLASDQREFGVSLYGGDTTSTPGPLTIAVTVFGLVPLGSMLRRSGAQPGDLVFVSGTIGDAGGGLACLKGDARSLNESDGTYLVRRFQRPEPRISLGQFLLGLASAAIDVSDGLVADLGHVAKASSLKIVLNAGQIPVSRELTVLWTDARKRIICASTSGDDYEIAFTTSPARRADVMRIAAVSGTVVTEIGRCEAGRGVILQDLQGETIEIPRPGYVHF